jgi:hypothetical protein
MNGWIAIDKELPYKPKTRRLAKLLNTDQFAAAGLCVAVWSWADSNTEDGFVADTTVDDVDSILRLAGVAAAMAHPSVGWIVAEHGGIRFPNWGRWNSKSAKRRMREAERKRQKRLEIKDET